MFFLEYLNVFYLILVHFLILSFYGKCFWSFHDGDFCCVGARISTLLSIADGSDPYVFRRRMEKTRCVEEEMDEKMFISRQSRHVFFVIIMIKVLCPTLYFDLACKQFCFPPRKCYKWEK